MRALLTTDTNNSRPPRSNTCCPRFRFSFVEGDNVSVYGEEVSCQLT
jgi:hypothetical protein